VFSGFFYFLLIQMILFHPSLLAPFGVKAGQKVSIAVINLNSNIPTFVVTESVIKAETPGLVSLAETIASSQDLADKVAAFVTTEVAAGGGGSNETNTTAPGPTPSPPVNESGGYGFVFTTISPTPSSANFVWTTSSFSSLLSWVGLLLLPLIV